MDATYRPMNSHYGEWIQRDALGFQAFVTRNKTIIYLQQDVSSAFQEQLSLYMYVRIGCYLVVNLFICMNELSGEVNFRVTLCQPSTLVPSLVPRLSEGDRLGTRLTCTQLAFPVSFMRATLKNMERPGYEAI